MNENILCNRFMIRLSHIGNTIFSFSSKSCHLSIDLLSLSPQNLHLSWAFHFQRDKSIFLGRESFMSPKTISLYLMVIAFYRLVAMHGAY